MYIFPLQVKIKGPCLTGDYNESFPYLAITKFHIRPHKDVRLRSKASVDGARSVIRFTNIGLRVFTVMLLYPRSRCPPAIIDPLSASVFLELRAGQV